MMALSLSDLVVDSKLDVKLFEDHSIQTRLVSNPTTGQRRTYEQEKWERTKVLGRGSFGVVWLERCTDGSCSGGVRAVKELVKGPANISEDYNRELEAIAKFSHKRYRDWFVRSFGWYESSSAVFITMEYLKLGDLEGYLQTRLTYTDARQIVQQLLEGLRFMHENNFAHRDLKPSNLLVLHERPKWWVKIADFGISKRINGTNLRTKIGTEAYLAPEVRGIYIPDSQDDGSTFSLAVDIWAVGAITFRMITGRLAFPPGRTLFDYVVGGKPFPTDPLMSPEFTDFVMKTMAASPHNRPTSQQALSFPWILEQDSTSEGPDVYSESVIKIDPYLNNTASTPTLFSKQWSTADINQEYTITHPQVPISFKEPSGIPSSKTATQKSSQPSIKIQEANPNNSDLRPAASTNLENTPTLPSLASAKLSENFATLRIQNNAPFTKPEENSSVENSSTSSTAIKKLQTFKFLQELKGHNRSVSSVAFSPNGQRLASGSDDTIRIWADKQGKFELAQELTGHTSTVWSVAFSSNGQRLASGGYDTIRIWADKQGKFELAQELTGHTKTVWSVAFSPNGQRLASGGYNTIRIWADKQGKFELAQELTGHTSTVWSVAFLSNGQRLASGGYNTIRIWADKQGKFELAQELTSPSNVLSVAFLPNGQRLASGSDDTIRIWADKQGKFELAQELTGHTSTVWSVAFSSNGQRLASGSSDKTIRIWGVEKHVPRETMS